MFIDYLTVLMINLAAGTALLAYFLRDAYEKGCVNILEWNKNYYEKGPLWRCRFFPYPRILRLVTWKFKPGIDLAGIGGYYEQHI